MTNNLIMSLLTFYMISDLIVDIIRSLHILFLFKYAFFTVSVFSLIVWIPAINGALKTTEYMGIVPGYNGAIFNTLLVFGLCLGIHQALRGELTSHMWPLNSDMQSDLATFFFIFNSLILPATLYLLSKDGYRYTTALGVLLTTIYLTVNLGLICLALVYVK